MNISDAFPVILGELEDRFNSFLLNKMELVFHITFMPFERTLEFCLHFII